MPGTLVRSDAPPPLAYLRARRARAAVDAGVRPATRRLRHHGVHVVGALVALLVLATVVLVPPALLAAWRGIPVPSGPELGDAVREAHFPEGFLVDAVASAAWIVWFVAVVTIAVEAVSLLTRRSAPAITVAGRWQPAAARLVTAVARLATLIVRRPVPVDRPRAPLPAPPERVTGDLIVPDTIELAMPAPVAGAAPGDGERDGNGDGRRHGPPTYRVERRDTLWGIAESLLGDPLRWVELWRLNQGRVQPDGAALDDPDHLRPGWVLELPEDVTRRFRRASGADQLRSDPAPSYTSWRPPAEENRG